MSKKFMDVLPDELSSDSDSDASGSDHQEEAEAPDAKKQKKQIGFEDLQKAGTRRNATLTAQFYNISVNPIRPAAFACSNSSVYCASCRFQGRS